MKTIVTSSVLALSLVSNMAMAAGKPSLVQHLLGSNAPHVSMKTAPGVRAFAPQTYIEISNDESYPVNAYLPGSNMPYTPVSLAPGYACNGAAKCPANTDVIEDDYTSWNSIEVRIADQYGNTLFDNYVPNHSSYFVSQLVGYTPMAKAKK